ncbi:MAG: hypothetical protein QOD58_20 [Mycobacterium sp.]|jgi:hypothetical protein|nr:hypothetical protein [Mycobacterium sp.]
MVPDPILIVGPQYVSDLLSENATRGGHLRL